MALKSITLSIDPAKVLQDNSVNLFRGDNVEFTLSVATSSVLMIASVTKWRLKICPIIRGKIDTDSANFIAKESTDVSTWKVSISSSESAIAAGDYALAVALLDASDEVAIGACFPIKISESGYIGIFTPTEDFRDAVLDALADAQAARDAAAASATASAASATSASGSASSASASATNAANSATSASGSATTATTKASDASNSATEAADAQTAAENAAADAENARDEAVAAANAWTASAMFIATWDASGNTAPASPEQGNWWWITSAGTFGSITWAVGDGAIWTGTAWNKVPVANLIEAEAVRRRNADLAKRGQTIDISAAMARIATMQYLAAPFDIYFEYFMPAQPTSATPDWSIYTNGSYQTGTATSYYGVYLYHTYASGINWLYLACSDGGSDTTAGRSIARWPFSRLSVGWHSAHITLADAWLDSVTGQLQTQLYVDGVLQTNSTGGNYGSPYFAGATTRNFSNRADNAARAALLHCSGYYNYTTTASTFAFRITKFAIFGQNLPLTRAANQVFSIEALADGERPPSTYAPILFLESRAGSQWRDASAHLTHAVIEGTPPAIEAPSVMVNTLTWSADGTAKAFLSSTNNVIPANSKVTVSAKSTVAATIDVTDGAASPTTLISGVALAANTWTTVGTAFVTSACKLAIDPTTSITGSISVQVKIEPLV